MKAWTVTWPAFNFPRVTPRVERGAEVQAAVHFPGVDSGCEIQDGEEVVA